MIRTIMGCPLTSAQATRIEEEVLQAGRRQLDSLIRDLGLLHKANQGMDFRDLGKQLAEAVRKSPEREKATIALMDEAGQIDIREEAIFSPREGIILTARESLMEQSGMTRRRFMRTLGGAAAALGLKAEIPSWIYDPSMPEFSRDKIIKRILGYALSREGQAYQFIARTHGLSGMVDLDKFRKLWESVERLPLHLTEDGNPIRDHPLWDMWGGGGTTDNGHFVDDVPLEYLEMYPEANYGRAAEVLIQTIRRDPSIGIGLNEKEIGNMGIHYTVKLLDRVVDAGQHARREWLLSLATNNNVGDSGYWFSPWLGINFGEDGETTATFHCGYELPFALEAMEYDTAL